MSSESDPDSGRRKSEVAGVFKSAGVSLHTIAPGSNSAISNVAVEREAEASFSAEHVHGLTGDALPTLSVAAADSVFPAGGIEKVAEELRATMAKVDTTVQAIEARNAELELSVQKAQALLDDVSRVGAALSLNDDLRKRIEATIRRTRALQDNLK